MTRMFGINPSKVSLSPIYKVNPLTMFISANLIGEFMRVDSQLLFKVILKVNVKSLQIGHYPTHRNLTSAKCKYKHGSSFTQVH